MFGCSTSVLNFIMFNYTLTAYLVDSLHYIYRIIWTIIVLGATVGFLYLVSIKLQALLANEITVTMEMKYNETIPFPAVTICNKNRFR